MKRRCAMSWHITAALLRSFRKVRKSPKSLLSSVAPAVRLFAFWISPAAFFRSAPSRSRSAALPRIASPSKSPPRTPPLAGAISASDSSTISGSGAKIAPSATSKSFTAADFLARAFGLATVVRLEAGPEALRGAEVSAPPKGSAGSRAGMGAPGGAGEADSGAVSVGGALKNDSAGAAEGADAGESEPAAPPPLLRARRLLLERAPSALAAAPRGPPSRPSASSANKGPSDFFTSNAAAIAFALPSSPVPGSTKNTIHL